MIAKLQGVVDALEGDSVVLMVGGVGYRVFVPASTANRLTVQEPATLHIYTHVREDAILLYGFHGKKEQQAFELLLTVSGVGPKLALTVLSNLTVDQLARAVRTGDSRMLTRVPGVGRKTAERLLLELKDRFSSWQLPELEADRSVPASAPSGAAEDAIAALVQLGYGSEESRTAVLAVLEQEGEMSVEETLRAALRRLQSV
ncbi:MAG: Holliday junction branch migration protein RuvA [Firmicutes bacterium]|jgi:Holliday junction DNA helicase RuvA|nr:Holliday junction branch migration protein RuvA [Bacillota bacterium]